MSEPMDLSNEQKIDEQINKRRWKNRRLISWISLYSILLILLFTMLNKDITNNQVDVLKYFGFFLSTFVIAYIGGNTLEYIKRGK